MTIRILNNIAYFIKRKITKIACCIKRFVIFAWKFESYGIAIQKTPNTDFAGFDKNRQEYAEQHKVGQAACGH